jgi:transposase
MTRPAYPTDLTDAQGRRLEPHIPGARPGGRPAAHDMRGVVDAILCVPRTGGVWRALPHDLPPWKAVYHDFRLWRRDGTWEAVHGALRDRVRQAAGRALGPSAAIIDRQSVRTTEKGGPAAPTPASG